MLVQTTQMSELLQLQFYIDDALAERKSALQLILQTSVAFCAAISHHVNCHDDLLLTNPFLIFQAHKRYRWRYLLAVVQLLATVYDRHSTELCLHSQQPPVELPH